MIIDKMLFLNSNLDVMEKFERDVAKFFFRLTVEIFIIFSILKLFPEVLLKSSTIYKQSIELVINTCDNAENKTEFCAMDFEIFNFFFMFSTFFIFAF